MYMINKAEVIFHTDDDKEYVMRAISIEQDGIIRLLYDESLTDENYEI